MDRQLGRIIRLQVQRDPLKSSGIGYDPAPVLAVAQASLDRNGMVGRHDGAWVLDAHHAGHPRARGGGNRALSLGFVGHYEAMATRFGSAEIGCAGENIILDTPGRVTESDLSGEVIVVAADGEVVLRNARVAAPCAEFTSWIKRLGSVVPKRDQEADVAFLDAGTRGFILDVSQLERPVTIRVGDSVIVRSTTA